jgi:ribonuclease E
VTLDDSDEGDEPPLPDSPGDDEDEDVDVNVNVDVDNDDDVDDDDDEDEDDNDVNVDPALPESSDDDVIEIISSDED